MIATTLVTRNTENTVPVRRTNFYKVTYLKKKVHCIFVAELNQEYEVMTSTEKGSDDLRMPELPVNLQDLFERSTMNIVTENKETDHQSDRDLEQTDIKKNKKLK